jgi:hypothetical protein
MGFFKKFENHLVAPKADINLQLSSAYVALGESLEGTLTVTPHEPIDAAEVRSEILCVETAQVWRTEYDAVAKREVNRQVTETRVLYSVKPACNPAIQLAAGTTKNFKISAGIPAGVRPTFQSVGDMVEWKIKGVVAVHGRPDVTTKEQVFAVVLPSQLPANEAPKVKLVSCEYCQAAMPETALVCPNCGARRTAQ